MIFSKSIQTCLVLVLALHLLAFGSASPTRPTPSTGTRSTDARGGGSSDGSRSSSSAENCNAELSDSEIRAITSDVREALSGISGIMQRVHVWTANGEVRISYELMYYICNGI